MRMSLGVGKNEGRGIEGDRKPFNDRSYYSFLAVLENIREEDNLVLENADRVYFKSLSVIWTSYIRLK